MTRTATAEAVRPATTDGAATRRPARHERARAGQPQQDRPLSRGTSPGRTPPAPMRRGAEAVPVLDPAMRYLAPAPSAPPAPGAHPAVRPRPAPRTPLPAPPGGRSVAAVVRHRVEVTLRLALEVLDLRRRPEQLRAFAVPAVADAVAALSRSEPPGKRLGGALLRRIHITAAGDDAAEVCATYVRGRRTLAIAARFEMRGELWTCTALHLA